MLNINLYNFRKFYSTFDNIVFVDNQSILLLPDLFNVKDVIIMFAKIGVDGPNRDNLIKPFFSKLAVILQELFCDDCYTFDFYFYIESSYKLSDVFTIDLFNKYTFNKMFGDLGYFKTISITINFDKYKTLKYQYYFIMIELCLVIYTLSESNVPFKVI
jgi:hypothetical protein